MLGKLFYYIKCNAMSKAKFVFIKNVIILKQFVIDSSDKERIDIAKQELFLTDRNQILYVFLIIKYFSYEQRTLFTLYL